MKTLYIVLFLAIFSFSLPVNATTNDFNMDTYMESIEDDDKTITERIVDSLKNIREVFTESSEEIDNQEIKNNEEGEALVSSLGVFMKALVLIVDALLFVFE